MYVSQPDNYLSGGESTSLVRQKAHSVRKPERERKQIKQGEGGARKGGLKLHISHLYREQKWKKRELGPGVMRGSDGNPHITLSE